MAGLGDLYQPGYLLKPFLNFIGILEKMGS